MTKKFLMVIDTGKPYELEFNTEEEVLKELEKQQCYQDNDDYAYLDINIYQDARNEGNPKIPYVDVTEDFFKMLEEKQPFKSDMAKENQQGNIKPFGKEARK